MAGYGRMAYPTAGEHLNAQDPGDYNPLHGTNPDYQQPAAYFAANRASAGPRPLEWNVGAGVTSAQGGARHAEPARYARPQEAAQWSAGSAGPGHLTNDYNYTAGLDTDTHVDAAYGSRAPPQKRSNVPPAGPPVLGYQPAVLGPEIAGYKSVVTKNPVSPSGYSLAGPAQQQPASIPAGRQRSTTTHVGAPHQQFTQPLTPAAPSSDYAPSNRSAAAAAAALAALGGNRTRSPQSQPAIAGGGRVGSYSSAAGVQYSGASFPGNYSNGPTDGYTAGVSYDPGCYQPPASAEAPNALHWKLPARASHSPGSATAGPVAGRRAAAATMATAPYAASSNGDDAVGGYVPSSASGNRPPSQQRSEGLSKLKQLSSARLASRITTPPTGDLAQPVAAGELPRSGPIAGRRSAGSSRATVAYAAAPAEQDASEYQEPQQRQPRQQQQQQQRTRDVQPSRPGYEASNYSESQYQPSTSQPRRVSATRPAAAAIGKAAPPPQQQREEQQAQPAGGYSSYDLSAAEVADEAAAGGEACNECPSCGRKFSDTAYDKHVKICDKVFGQKRKAFNMQQQRLNPEAAKYVGKAGSSAGGGKAGASVGGSQMQQGASGKGISSKQLDNRPAVSAAAAKKSKWQAQSDQLRAAMRAAQGGSSSGAQGGYGGGPVPAYEAPDDRIPCPHCGRRFAELAAERHIPKCSEIMAKPKVLKAGGGTGAYMRNNPQPVRNAPPPRRR